MSRFPPAASVIGRVSLEAYAHTCSAMGTVSGPRLPLSRRHEGSTMISSSNCAIPEHATPRASSRFTDALPSGRVGLAELAGARTARALRHGASCVAGDFWPPSRIWRFICLCRFHLPGAATGASAEYAVDCVAAHVPAVSSRLRFAQRMAEAAARFRLDAAAHAQTTPGGGWFAILLASRIRICHEASPAPDNTTGTRISDASRVAT